MWFLKNLYNFLYNDKLKIVKVVNHSASCTRQPVHINAFINKFWEIINIFGVCVFLFTYNLLQILFEYFKILVQFSANKKLYYFREFRYINMIQFLMWHGDTAVRVRNFDNKKRKMVIFTDGKEGLLILTEINRFILFYCS